MKLILSEFIRTSLLLTLMVLLPACVQQAPLSPDQASGTVNNSPTIITNFSPNIAPKKTVVVYKNGGDQRLARLNIGNDPDGDILYYSLLAYPKNGTLSKCLGLNLSTTTDLDCLYLPNPDVVGKGADSFTYAALDRKGGQANVLVTIDVIENTNPVPVNKSVSVLGGGTSATAQSLGSISPATDAEGDPLSYVPANFPAHGTLSNCMGLSGTTTDDLICDYTPVVGYYGSDSFSYYVFDNHGGQGTGTITINVQSTNHNPTASVNPFTASAIVNKGAQALDISTLVIGDVDTGDTLTYALTTAPTKGQLYGCLGLSGSTNPPPDLSCTYTPSTGLEGTAADSFYFTVTDGHGGSLVEQIKINMNNTAPTAQSITYSSLQEDTPASINFTLNDQGEGDLAKVEGTSPLNTLGVFDGKLSKGTLSSCMGLNGTSQVPGSSVTCSYTPSTNATGTDSFTYKVTDLGGKSGSGTVTLVLNAVNDAPSLSAQTFTVYEANGAQPITIAPPSDPDVSDTFTYALNSGPSLGTLSNCMGLNGTSSSDNICDFNPGSNTSTSTFSVTATDSGGLSSTATMSVNIIVTRQGPIFATHSATSTASITERTTTASATSTASLGNFDLASVPSGPAPTYTLISKSNPFYGALSLCPSVGATSFSCSYSPPVNKCGSPLEYLDIKATDTLGRYDTFRIYVNVNCTNTAPTPASSTTFQIYEMLGTQTLPTIASATDPDGGTPATNDVLSYSLQSAPANGTLSNCLGLNFTAGTDLSCDYSINSNLLGTDIVTATHFDDFTYMVSDGQGGTSTRMISIQVLPVNSTPSVDAIANQFTTKGSGIYGVTTVVDEGGASDEDSQSMLVQVKSSDQNVFADSNIKIYYGADRTAAYANFISTGSSSTYSALGDGAADASAKKLYIDLVPEAMSASSASASATITVSVKESTPISAPVASVAFTATVLNVSTDHPGWAAATAQGARVDKNGTQLADGSLSFSWNSFTLTSTGISTLPSIVGYNVYRSASGGSSTNFDFGNPITTTPVNVDVRSYTDTTLSSSLFSSTSSVAYWYRIRPVLDNGAVMDTSTHAYTSLRMLVPPKNKALVQRWMANLDLCKRMGKLDNGVQSQIDRENNYRCKYDGPGNINVSGTGHWDLGQDLLVDMFEVGCRYTDSFCGGADCIGNASPNGSVTSSLNNIYYDRSTGNCYINRDGATSWKTISDLTAASGHSSTAHVTADLGAFATGGATVANQPYLPPLTHVTQLEAYDYCSSTNFGINVSTSSGLLAGSPFYGRTPARKEQIAAASWTESLGDDNINTLEAGTDLTLASACNSSSGGGLTFYDNPASYGFDTYPGTNSSGLRFLRTGSFSTRQCLSRYGIQDMVGNVEEWATDHFYCQTSTSCNGVHSTSALFSSYFLSNNDMKIYPNSGTTIYNLDGSTSNTGPGGSTLTEWVLATTPFQASKFFLPMGLPAVSTYPQTSTNGVLAIDGGASVASITTGQLHGDKFTVNAGNLLSASMVVQYLAGVTSGGSYSSGGTGAGMFNLELLDSFSSTPSNVGLRCYTPVPNP